MKHNTFYSKGFTALELLVVLGIIGILISVALTGIDLSRKRARDNARIADVQNIILSLEQYHDTCREYPENIYATTPFTSNGCSTGTSWESFMSATPLDQDGVTEYLFTGIRTSPGGRCTGYHIGTVLEQDNNKSLQADSDVDSLNDYKCDLSTGYFDGDEASLPPGQNVYDVYKN